jgi:hypothetical protein
MPTWASLFPPRQLGDVGGLTSTPQRVLQSANAIACENRFRIFSITRDRSLPSRNEKTRWRITPCAARRSHLDRAKFIPEFSAIQRSIVSQIPAMPLDLF